MLSQHILRVNYWKLGEHEKLDMFEPVWFVQHVNVDSMVMMLIWMTEDSRIVFLCNIHEDSDNAYDD